MTTDKHTNNSTHHIAQDLQEQHIREEDYIKAREILINNDEGFDPACIMQQAVAMAAQENTIEPVKVADTSIDNIYTSNSLTDTGNNQESSIPKPEGEITTENTSKDSNNNTDDETTNTNAPSRQTPSTSTTPSVEAIEFTTDIAETNDDDEEGNSISTASEFKSYTSYNTDIHSSYKFALVSNNATETETTANIIDTSFPEDPDDSTTLTNTSTSLTVVDSIDSEPLPPIIEGGNIPTVTSSVTTSQTPFIPTVTDIPVVTIDEIDDTAPDDASPHAENTEDDGDSKNNAQDSEEQNVKRNENSRKEKDESDEDESDEDDSDEDDSDEDDSDEDESDEDASDEDESDEDDSDEDASDEDESDEDDSDEDASDEDASDEGPDAVIFLNNTDKDDLIKGTTESDTLTANGGNDTLKGGNGDDNLFDNNGDDQLYGNKGNDNIHTSVGNDTLTGGKGDDNFVIKGTDGIVISDFSKGSNHISLSDTVFIFSSKDGNKAEQSLEQDQDIFITNSDFDGGNFEGTNSTFMYDTTDGELWYDADASAAENALLVLTINDHNKYSFSADDFMGW